jgi:DEAD/DEAH box helicase domain-containing protein
VWPTRHGDAGIVRGYRGGYLPLRRREVEQGLRAGEVLGVVATSALELGIDIGHLDVAGSPAIRAPSRPVAAGWTRGRRTGRGGRDGGDERRWTSSSSPIPSTSSARPRARAHQPREPVHPVQPPEVRAFDADPQ